MYIQPKALSEKMNPEELRKDKENAKNYGPCGVGDKALYLNSHFIDRHYYVPVKHVKRVYKKVAMSKGGFSGKGAFGSIPYLVVEYDQESIQCTFKFEHQVDELLTCIRKKFPYIKTVSEAAAKRLAQAEAQRKARLKKHLSKEDLETIHSLKEAKGYLEDNQAVASRLSETSRAKRVYESTNPAYQWVALAICIFGLLTAVYGGYSFFTHTGGFGLYFLLFGLAAIFLFSSANVLPTRKNNGKAIEAEYQDAIGKMEDYLADYPDFPLPARYAHPASLDRMIRSVEEGRADSVDEAFEDLKKGLKALNADTKVSQEEYDEVVAIKPMFLLAGYQ